MSVNAQIGALVLIFRQFGDLAVVTYAYGGPCSFNLQASKLFIVTSATKGRGVVTTPLRFSIRLKTLYCVIQSLIQLAE